MTTPPDAQELGLAPVHTRIHGANRAWTLTRLEALPGDCALLWFDSDHSACQSPARVLLSGVFTAAGLVPDDYDDYGPEGQAVCVALRDALNGGALTVAQTSHALTGAITHARELSAAGTSPDRHTHAVLTDLLRVAACYTLPDATDRAVALGIFNAGGFDGTPEELVALATAANTPPGTA